MAIRSTSYSPPINTHDHNCKKIFENISKYLNPLDALNLSFVCKQAFEEIDLSHVYGRYYKEILDKQLEDKKYSPKKELLEIFNEYHAFVLQMFKTFNNFEIKTLKEKAKKSFASLSTIFMSQSDKELNTLSLKSQVDRFIKQYENKDYLRDVIHFAIINNPQIAILLITVRPDIDINPDIARVPPYNCPLLVSIWEKRAFPIFNTKTILNQPKAHLEYIIQDPSIQKLITSPNDALFDNFNSRSTLIFLIFENIISSQNTHDKSNINVAVISLLVTSIVFELPCFSKILNHAKKYFKDEEHIFISRLISFSIFQDNLNSFKTLLNDPDCPLDKSIIANDFRTLAFRRKIRTYLKDSATY